MTHDNERAEYARWILERNLHWIAAAEAKIGVIVAIDTAMLGALAAAYSSAAIADRCAWAILLTVLSAGGLVVAILCGGMCVLPRTTGPVSSFLFFGRIVSKSAADYSEAFIRATNSELLEDCLAQIHRNAEIASEKFRWVRVAMLWSFGAVLPWLAAIACLMKG